MGRDDHPRLRHARKIERKAARRDAFDRVLIVTEGEKTEVNYFEEIRQEYRLPSTSVRVCPAKNGTNPLQVVEYASELCQETREWERIFAVIDRDDHAHYDEALLLAAKLNGAHRNDEKKPIAFAAVPSNPCFELWLLLHFQQQDANIHRDDVMRRLDGHMKGYRKGRAGVFAATAGLLENAYANAGRLREQAEQSYQNPSTDVDFLLQLLTTLREPNPN